MNRTDESYDEQMSRLRAMSEDSPKWDLSPKDCSAIRTALGRIAELEAELAKLRELWVSVKDEIPPTESRIVLGFIKDGPAIIMSSKTVTMRDKLWKYVTHWMPLPEPPKEVSHR